MILDCWRWQPGHVDTVCEKGGPTMEELWCLLPELCHLHLNFCGRIVPSKRAASAVPLQLGPAPPRDEIIFRYRDEEAEEVERYALSKEGLEESQREIDEAREHDGEALTVEAGVPAPSAPQRDEPSGGLRTPPALDVQPGERGAGGEIPMVIEPLTRSKAGKNRRTTKLEDPAHQDISKWWSGGLKRCALAMTPCPGRGDDGH